MVLSLLVVWVKMYRFLLRVVVRVGCCYCDSLEVLLQENQVVWDAALATHVSLLGRCLCGTSWAGSKPSSVGDGMLSGILSFGILPTVTFNSSAPQSCLELLSLQAGRNFACFL